MLKKILFLSMIAASSSAYCQAVGEQQLLSFALPDQQCNSVSVDENSVLGLNNKISSYMYGDERLISSVRMNYNSDYASVTCHRLYPLSSLYIDNMASSIYINKQLFCSSDDYNSYLNFSYTKPDGSLEAPSKIMLVNYGRKIEIAKQNPDDKFPIYFSVTCKNFPDYQFAGFYFNVIPNP